MRFSLLFLSLGIAPALNGCAARVMTMPLEAGTTVASAQTQPTGENPGAGFDPRGSGGVDDASSPISETGTTDADSSSPSDSPTIDTPTSSYTIGMTSPAPAASPSPVPETPAFLAEKPVTGNSGDVSFLIDAPDGSTATYSLDRNDAIDCGMSFGLDAVPPGDHTIEIVIRYPNGETVVLEHDWFQASPPPSPTPSQPVNDAEEKTGRRDGRDRGNSEDHRQDERAHDAKDEGRAQDDRHGQDDGHGQDQDESHGKSGKK